MKLKIAITTLLAIVFMGQAKAQEKLEITGYARNYTGVLTGGDNEFSIVQNTLNLKFEKNWKFIFRKRKLLRY